MGALSSWRVGCAAPLQLWDRPRAPPCHVSRPSRRVCAQAALRGRKEAGPGPRAGALPRCAPEQRVFQDDRHERCHGTQFSGSFSGLCCRNPRTAKRCAPSTRVDVQFPPSKDACPAFTDKRRIPPQDYPLPWKGSTASPASTLPALPLVGGAAAPGYGCTVSRLTRRSPSSAAPAGRTAHAHPPCPATSGRSRLCGRRARASACRRAGSKVSPQDGGGPDLPQVPGPGRRGDARPARGRQVLWGADLADRGEGHAHRPGITTAAQRAPSPRGAQAGGAPARPPGPAVQRLGARGAQVQCSRSRRPAAQPRAPASHGPVPLGAVGPCPLGPALAVAVPGIPGSWIRRVGYRGPRRLVFAAAVASPSELRRAPKLDRHPGGAPWLLWGGLRRGQKPQTVWVKSSNVCVRLNSIFNNSRVCCRLKHSLRYNPNSKDERVSSCDVERSPSRFRGAGCSAACQMEGQRVRLRWDCCLWSC